MSKIKSQERAILSRERHAKKWIAVMNANKGRRDARAGRMLEPYAGESVSYQPKVSFAPARRLKIEQARSILESGAQFERDNYGCNRIYRRGICVGSITDTDARRLGLI